MEKTATLPWDLVEEILSRLPPKPLVRLRTVCKQWKTLVDDNTFINNHKKTFRFILVTKSKVYSVSLNPKIEVRELTLNIPGLKDEEPNDLVECNGFILCGMAEGAVVCNPWLGQTRCIQGGVNQSSFEYLGIGYDDNTINKKIVYKTLASDTSHTTTVWKIHDFDTDEWKDEEEKPETTGESNLIYIHSTRGVSLNGNLFFIAYGLTRPSFFIVFYNFRREKNYNLCDLPCAQKDHSDTLVLRVYRGDRFSLLKQCHVTKKIQIWVVKDKIDIRSRMKVKWRIFMEVSIPNLPDLIQMQSYYQPSYFIDDKRGSKRLVVCSCDVDGRAWIYVVGENKLISKTRLDSVVDPWPLHCTCFPSLVMVPGCQREEGKANLQVNYSFLWFFVWLFLKLKFLFSKIKYF
ncbi:putative F-box/kelch-repeat protein At1g32430 [Raphanus sativus]|uniref:F-box/kelch-repeat protein At1g32430 n=1 Tax=Raphanus sativus TaxID=3726 RepID=A0A9W3C8B2_RAPSA|nr:putative F-box/kelch-repeat protein At1g32430 [Raphanus sativus]